MEFSNPGKWSRSDVHRAGLLAFFRADLAEQIAMLRAVDQYERSPDAQAALDDEAAAAETVAKRKKKGKGAA